MDQKLNLPVSSIGNKASKKFEISLI